MPQKLSDIYEPNTAKIIDRIKAIDGFIDAGYEVHVNFSPVIVYDNWLEDYEELFYMMSNYVDNKDEVLAEVIFMTHNISTNSIFSIIVRILKIKVDNIDNSFKKTSH